jgi:hypothetical protein
MLQTIRTIATHLRIISKPSTSLTWLLHRLFTTSSATARKEDTYPNIETRKAAYKDQALRHKVMEMDFREAVRLDMSIEFVVLFVTFLGCGLGERRTRGWV